MGVCQSSGKVVQPQKVDESVPVEESKEAIGGLGGVPHTVSTSDLNLFHTFLQFEISTRMSFFASNGIFIRPVFPLH